MGAPTAVEVDLAVFQVWEVAQVVFPTVVVLVVFLTLAVVPMAVSVVEVVAELEDDPLYNSNMMDKSGIVPSLPTLI